MAGDPSRTDGQQRVRLEVRRLGAVEIILDGQRLPAFNSLRLQRFLAMIVMRDDLQHRSRLSFELWPESSESQARTNLRKLIHDFRQALPDIEEFVEIDNEIVRWIPTGSSDIDVLKFRDALSDNDFEVAANTYSGDLLPACYEDWVLSERERLRAEAHAVFVQLTKKASALGDHKAVLKGAQRVIDLEPTDETAVRMQMQAHDALGDRVAAVRSYHRYAEALQRDLGVEPDETTQDIYKALLRRTATEEASNKDARSVAESPFVGRERELNQLAEVWDASLAGRSHLVLITGEPGIGKSRLATEFGRLVRAQGHVLAASRAYEAAGRLPWGPVVDLLRSPDISTPIDALEVVWRAELARLLPELIEGAQPALPCKMGEPVQRHRLFDAVNRAITAGHRPRLLIIDDLQWCDAETIELVGYVVRCSPAAPILIVGTVRSEEVPIDHPLLGLVDALRRDQAVTTVPLDRLDQATTTALAFRLGGADSIDEKLASRIWKETEGNPLFIIEALRAGINDDGQRILTPTMRAVFGARLGQLPDDVRQIAEVAAVIGRPFSVALLASAMGMGEDKLVDRIDELWRRRIIRDQRHKYDFSHDKLRAVALEMVSPARRRQLHRAVAEAIREEFGDDVEAASPRLAAHYDQAGMIEAAIEAYRVAGARASAVSALDEAVGMFRRALSLVADLRPSEYRDGLELEIRLALGPPLVALEGYGSPSSHQLYERALLLCRKQGRPAAPPILRGLGLARLQGCRFEDCSESGLALLDSESPVAKTEGSYLLGVSAFWRGDLTAARRHLTEAIKSYDTSHRDEHLALYAQDPKAVCLVRLAWVELWAGNAVRADETARSAVSLATDLDHLMTLSYVLTYAAIIAAESEDLQRLTELLDQEETLRKRASLGYLGIVTEALRAWVDICEGSPSGIEKIADAVALSRAEGETLHLTYCLLLLARACARAGDLEGGRVATREGLSWSSSRNQRYLEAELCRTGGELAHRAGDPKTTLASLWRAVDLAHSQGARWLELKALRSLTARFPDRSIHERLGNLVETLPPGHNLPAFRAAAKLLD